jgi:hypothetical protein
MNNKIIGTGRLNWRRYERVEDRYGTVCLMHDEDEDSFDLARYTGFGKLIATIKETRDSSHLGDLFHGFFPTKPEIGEVIELGEGDIFYDHDEYGYMVGLKPRDNRRTFWLNPKALYRCHEQTVELSFQTVEVNN